MPTLMLPLLPLLLAAWATVPPAETRTIYVMRHLNTPAGMPDPDLTAEGLDNARRLATWFEGRELAAILVSTTKRARQTVEPLASAKGLEPRAYDPRNRQALLHLVNESQGDVLIVGHTNTVPEIIQSLGGDRPGEMAHEQFGDVWEIQGGATRRHRLAD